MERNICEDEQYLMEKADKPARSFSLKKVILHFGVPLVLPELDGQTVEQDSKDGRPERHSPNCIPCLFYTRKNDGCWKGNACEFCHLCNKQEGKRRRNKIQLENRKRKKAEVRLQ